MKSLCRAYYASVEDQKDVFQDIVLQLWRSFDAFRGESEIGTWIYRVSLNTILNKVRNDKRKIVSEALSSAESHLSNAMADDDTEILHVVLQSLKDVDKAVVILYLEGYKNKEIATILNITATNVSTRFNRIKAELKSRFKIHDHEIT
ncbi:RNA polymerase [Pseudochryseolinea flava]|uniref:RNA polymerase n=2 Tax=Pseudochryseolinea flava TaxID=2059302 RepID=A0A364Y4M5_9BACT|nr:RNA polymerase [Pseudochryseolinea flava]